MELSGLVKGLLVCGGDDRIGALNKKVGHGDQLQVASKHSSFITCTKSNFVPSLICIKSCIITPLLFETIFEREPPL